jgi:hypothetical protein
MMESVKTECRNPGIESGACPGESEQVSVLSAHPTYQSIQGMLACEPPAETQMRKPVKNGTLN